MRRTTVRLYEYKFNSLQIMRKGLLISSLLLFTLIGFAQSNAIRNDILNYKDTTVDFISKGRNYLTNKLIEGDVASVRAIKNELLLAENDKYMALTPYEIRLLLYWLGDYDELFYFINSFDKQTTDKLRLKIKPGQDVLLENLLESLRKNRTKIEKNISTHVENTENRDFLILNLRFMLGSKDYPDVTRESLNADADTFLIKHPDSHYAGYTREYIRYRMVSSNWGFGFEFFSGYGLTTHKLNDKFGGNIPIGVAFDIGYKKWTLYLRDYIGIGRTYQNINVNGTVWPDNTKANVIVPEASLGYNFPTKSRIQFAPFVGIGGVDFAPTSNQKGESYFSKVGNLGSFAYTVGLNLDIRLGKTSSVISYSEIGNWFLRIRYAYIMPQFGSSYAGFEGNMHYLTIGIAAFAHNVKRKY